MHDVNMGIFIVVLTWEVETSEGRSDIYLYNKDKYIYEPQAPLVA